MQAIDSLSSERSELFRIALVCMPFHGAGRPSIQIGLLHAIATENNFSVDSYHLNLNLAYRLTPEVYESLCDHRGKMTGEWLFSVAAFGEETNVDDEAYFNGFPTEIARIIETVGKDTKYISRLRHEILPEFINDCLEMIEWRIYQVVGFTSTYLQNAASLALARRIKERYPTVKIIFGGANFDNEMGPEYMRAFPFIDYAVMGEGDLLFPSLLNCLAMGKQPEPTPGLVMRKGDSIVSRSQEGIVRDLDALPTPNYDEYFERANRLGLFSRYPLIIPFESSRGCWWGQKHHCTFCGLNGLGLTYRSKSPRRVLSELSELARKYRVTFFAASDNILDIKYARELFSTIARTKTDYQFFYEVKANLTRDQLSMLYKGGVRRIQPGIESMSSHILQLMRKGCTMIQNVYLLKWARFLGLSVGWNLLWGFPGETEDDYHQELEILKLISHLEPPSGCGRIRLERFAPYYTDRGSFPIHHILPEESYYYVYPTRLRFDKAAYFFDYVMENTLPDEHKIHRNTEEWVQVWQQQWCSEQPDTLTYRRTLDSLFIDDNRQSSLKGTYAFQGPLALIYDYCNDKMPTIPQVAKYLQATLHGYHVREKEIQEALDEFCDRGLMLSEKGKYLSLALPTNPNL